GPVRTDAADLPAVSNSEAWRDPFRVAIESRGGNMRVAVMRTVLTLFAATLLLPAPLRAQQTGTLSGVVRDAQGGVLPGVSVSVSSPALIGGARTVTTGELGT